VFTAKTTLLPPTQQGSASALIGSFGNLAGLAGASLGRTPSDQYVSMLASRTIADRLVDEFGLLEVYGAQYRFHARDLLAANTRILSDKKDGLISIEVDDESPKRAADLANAYVRLLREMTSGLALTEAKQRRQFFERELTAARKSLAKAQAELQSSSISESMLRAEPKAAADAVSSVRAEATSTEIQLRVLRRILTDSAPEVQLLMSRLGGLRDELARLERQQPKDSSNYIDKYREFKYWEGLTEAFGRQFELARLDETRDGSTIQVIDIATLPEWKSRPKRARATLIAGITSFFSLAGLLIARSLWQLVTADSATAAKVLALRQAVGRKNRT
jgi:uncharacterized protein involved in exopolysaccharide biosynthesis